MTSLHSMSLAILQAKKLRDDESRLLSPVPARIEKRDSYPWHHFQDCDRAGYPRES